jgi:hypothetical protein
MIRWFVTRIDLASASVHLLNFRQLAPARRDFLAAFPVQAPNDSSIDRPSRNSANAVSPATFAASGERKPCTLTFTPIGVFPVTKFPAKPVRATTLLGDSNKVISMCRDRDHLDSQRIVPTEVQSFCRPKERHCAVATALPTVVDPPSQPARRSRKRAPGGLACPGTILDGIDLASWCGLEGVFL